jgi:hypothetical protein
MKKTIVMVLTVLTIFSAGLTSVSATVYRPGGNSGYVGSGTVYRPGGNSGYVGHGTVHRPKTVENKKSNNSSGDRTVYIAPESDYKNSDNKHVYHYNSSCGNMKDSVEIKLSDAEKRDYDPCKKCVK